MKKSLLLLLCLCVMFVMASGCATKEYVKQQIDPLVDRISKLEARVSALEAKMPGVAADAA